MMSELSFVSLYYYPGYFRNIMLRYPRLLHLKQKDTVRDKVYFGIKNMFR